jgi:hypothetical protein
MTAKHTVRKQANGTFAVYASNQELPVMHSIATRVEANAWRDYYNAGHGS